MQLRSVRVGVVMHHLLLLERDVVLEMMILILSWSHIRILSFAGSDYYKNPVFWATAILS